MTSRVSPNGRYLAFMSERSLTGYDNIDVSEAETEEGVAESGGSVEVKTKVHPDEEVFLYDAGSGSHPPTLVCASCDPTGARPVGSTGGESRDSREWNDRAIWAERWVAGAVPGWTPENNISALYQSRYLSNSGRLFFDSHDALVPADVNGTEDVYEYEPAGIESPGGKLQCSQASASGSDVFKPETAAEPAGCVGLISAGSSAQESAFIDASEMGGDVFFLTTSKLAPQDYDTSYDIYDAHECTAASPCAPPPAAQPPACTTEASCKPSPTPQPGIYGPPASATFNGPGNLTSPPPAIVKKVTRKTVKCKRNFTKKHNKCVRKKKTKAKRSAHTNRRARS